MKKTPPWISLGKMRGKDIEEGKAAQRYSKVMDLPLAGSMVGAELEATISERQVGVATI